MSALMAQWQPGLTEQRIGFVTCPRVRAVHRHLQIASQLWMPNLKDAPAAELQHVKSRGIAGGLLSLETPEKGNRGVNDRREESLSLIQTVSREIPSTDPRQCVEKPGKLPGIDDNPDEESPVSWCEVSAALRRDVSRGCSEQTCSVEVIAGKSVTTY